MSKPEAQSLFSSSSEPSEQTYTTSPQYTQKLSQKAVSESHTYEMLASDAISSGPNPSQLRRTPGLWSQWWVEILNCILMMGTLCAIIGILHPNQTKPLPEWPFDVSINMAVSILSTGLKTSAVLIFTEGISHLKWRWFQASTRPCCVRQCESRALGLSAAAIPSTCNPFYRVARGRPDPPDLGRGSVHTTVGSLLRL